MLTPKGFPCCSTSSNLKGNPLLWLPDDEEKEPPRGDRPRYGLTIVAVTLLILALLALSFGAVFLVAG